MLETIIYVVLAIGLVGVVIWAADRYLVIPGPFGWIKGLIMFAIIVVACYFIWDTFVAHRIAHTRYGLNEAPTPTMATAPTTASMKPDAGVDETPFIDPLLMIAITAH